MEYSANNAMSIEDINTLQAWMDQGLLYEAEGYLFWDSKRNPLNVSPKPVQYPICAEIIANKDDFPLWVPSHVYGQRSPWSHGVPTVNFHYACKLLGRV